ncbi:hypothetical protein [Chitinophaga nivalis]|uniref:TMhelix containing protein n=1 Tax=Chitinophaga nivalis TaxID=2991709 RepID=A0ABT3IIN3_9BACT|nr:hypothetical protein [Chitinophaga nivalis]MCW3466488.1 hypothetical protein [Chitinophaga nivalis]MCW3483821.1 hypothetical protein [Chitinophaga nivalis]
MNAQVKVWQLLAAAAAFIIAVGTLIFNTGAMVARTESRVGALEVWKIGFVADYRLDMKEVNRKQDEIIKSQGEILILLQSKQDKK